MGFYNNEELPFVKKCEGIILDAKYSNKITLLRFLNQREIEILNQLKERAEELGVKRNTVMIQAIKNYCTYHGKEIGIKFDWSF